MLRPVQLALWQYPVLFGAALVAGCVDAVAGGGGLIALPALLSVGMPVPLALGTNKFQSTFGSVTASWHFARRGLVDLRTCRTGIALTLAGALAGAFTVQQIDSHFLGHLVPWLLAAILVYTLLRPAIGLEDHPPRMRESTFYVVFGLGLGFYDGFFGPGTGSFWAIGFVLLLGHNFTKATGLTKVMNATSNLAALALFALGGLVEPRAGLVMAAGQFLGARLGAGLVVTRGAKFIRPVFLTMVTLTLARLLWVNYRP